MLRISLLLLLLCATPALAEAPEDGRLPDSSNLVWFAMAAGGVWFVRRAMRARLRNRKDKR